MSVWILPTYTVKFKGELSKYDIHPLQVAGEEELATLVKILARSGVKKFDVEAMSIGQVESVNE